MPCTALGALLALSYLIFNRSSIISPLLQMRKLRIIVIKQFVETYRVKVAIEDLNWIFLFPEGGVSGQPTGNMVSKMIRNSRTF